VAMRRANARNSLSRDIEIGGFDRRLVHFSEDGPLIFLNFATLKFAGPGQASKSQPITRFPMTPDGRFAYETTLLYDSQAGYAFIQSNRVGSGMGPGAIANYLQCFVDGGGIYFQFIDMVDEEARDRARRMQQIRFVNFRVAISPIRDKDNIAGLGPISALADGLDSNSFEVKFSVGRQRKRSLHRRALSLVEALLDSFTDGGVEKLEVSGRGHEDDPLEVIDLLYPREKRKTELRVDPISRIIPHTDRWRALARFRLEFMDSLQ